MYASAWPVLSPGDFIRRNGVKNPPFPLKAAHTTYFFRARNAIYHLVRSLRFREGEAVLAPAYHSGNEVWAIRAAGASVHFYPINRRLEPDLDAVVRLCRSKRPRALFVIHFVGWPQPMKELTAVCREHGLILIEDCALSLLSQADGRPLGTYGDYAIFCLYKTLPVPNGGMLVQNTHILEDLTALDLRACGMASVTSRTAELLLEWTRMRANHLGSALLAVKRGLGSVLRVKRLPVGDIGFDPESVKTAMSGISARLLQRFDYDGIRRRRRENFLLMRHKLAGRATLLREDLADGVCPLFFPILVPDKRAAAQALRRHGIEAVELWNYGDAEAARQEFPDAHFLRDHVLELPIHQGISRAQVEYTADQVLRLNLHF